MPRFQTKVKYVRLFCEKEKITIENPTFPYSRFATKPICNYITTSHISRLLHRKCSVRIFIHESQNFRNERVCVVSKVLHFLWCNLFVIYIRPISFNKPSKYNSVFFIFHTVKYRVIFHRYIG